MHRSVYSEQENKQLIQDGKDCERGGVVGKVRVCRTRTTFSRCPAPKHSFSSPLPLCPSLSFLEASFEPSCTMALSETIHPLYP